MDTNYKTDIDYSVLTGEEMNSDILKYIQENFFKEGRCSVNIGVLYRFLGLICKSEKIQPSLEQYLYILCNYKRILNEACAGAGKTTMSKYKMILANLFYGIKGNNILAIAYNQQNRDDIKNKYEYSARKLNKVLPNNMHVDTNIIVRTFHSWCMEWVETYRARFKCQKINILTEAEQADKMRSRVVKYVEKNQITSCFVNDKLIDSLVKLYMYMKETVTDEDEEAWNLCSAREDIKGLTSKDIKTIFNSYDSFKKLTRIFDFSDLLEKMWELVNDPEVLARIRNNYQFILIDEYQDITQSMSRIIEMIVNGDPSKGIEPYNDCYLVCIGDGDQSIYGFRGTDSDNCIKFRPKYSTNGLEDEVRITSMSINRRCKSEILNQAKVIIESVQNRIEKPVRYLTEGGNVTVKQYTTVEDELFQVLQDLKDIKNLNKTCICYRNNASSIYLAMELFDRNIPFEVLRGTKPLEDFYTRNLINVIEMINSSYSIDLARDNLYKVLPNVPACYNKKVIQNYCTEYLKTLEAHPEMDRRRFFEFTFNGSENVACFNRAMAILRKANAAMKRNAPMSSYMPEVIELLYDNYVNGLMKSILSNSITPEYVKFVNKYFSQNISYEVFDKQMREKKKQLEENKDEGVKLTTMHGLKGLEFDNVIVIDLDDTIYPGRELASKNLTERQAVKIELESRRLLYVTVTRAKDNLTLYFYQNCPTRYYEFFVNNSDLAEKYSKCAENSYFVQEAKTVELMNKVNSIEDEFVFEDDLTSDDNDLTNNFSQPKQDTGVDDLDFDDLFDSVEESTKQEEKPSDVIDTSLNERDIMPGVKSILDILNLKE